jgi:hypothetical protein
MRPTDAHYEPTDETVTMLGLDSFTTYFFQVVAYNSNGDGPGSNVVGPLSTPESGRMNNWRGGDNCPPLQ